MCLQFIFRLFYPVRLWSKGESVQCGTFQVAGKDGHGEHGETQDRHCSGVADGGKEYGAGCSWEGQDVGLIVSTNTKLGVY